MRRIPKATLFGAGGATITVAIAHQVPLLVVAGGVLFVLAGALVGLIWAVVFAETDGPTSRFERVIASLAQFAHRSTTPPRTDTTVTRPRDSPQDRGDPG